VLGAGTVINPMIKIVTTVAILAAAYLFIVKPVLNTTDKAIDSAGKQFRQAQQQSERASAAADLGFARSRAHSFAQSLQGTWPAAARKVRSCVRRAGDDARAMERCDALGQRLVHVVQSDRSFALSYADSLAAQGDHAAASRVRSCVKAADYRPAAMERCRRLADDLLFG